MTRRSTQPDTMRAYRLETFGGPEVLQMEDTPVPVPSDNEVLVQAPELSEPLRPPGAGPITTFRRAAWFGQ